MSMRIKFHAPQNNAQPSTHSRVLQFADYSRAPSAPLAPPALPAHEQAARKRRADILAFPNAASLRTPSQPKPDPSIRKTFDTRILSAPKKFSHEF
ncbi:MAG: hypothetical protein ACRYFU_17710 [Janthinobacterium lividum]